MKTRASKTPAAQAKENNAFFGKEGKGAFFGARPGQESFFGGAEAGVVQTKLTVGEPNDVYEKEADATADKVVRRLSENKGNVQKKCAECEQKEQVRKKPIFESEADPAEAPLRRKEASSATPAVTPSVESGLRSSKGGGTPLPAETRKQMEAGIGADFSGVRVHNDGSARKMSKDLNAQAFTHGKDIYFNSGKYDPASASGKHLLAHELTHVVQQGGGVARKAAGPDRASMGQAANSVAVASTGQAARGAAVASTGQAANHAAGPAPETVQEERIQKKELVEGGPLGNRIQREGGDGTPAAGSGTAPSIPGPPYAKDGYTLDPNASPKSLVIPKITLPAFKTRNQGKFKWPLLFMGGRVGTDQINKWTVAVKSAADAATTTYLSDKDKKMPGEIYFLKSMHSDFILFGTADQIKQRSYIPDWDRKGGPRTHQVDHIFEMQLGGPDTPDNYELLDATANGSIGPTIQGEVYKRIRPALKLFKDNNVPNVPSFAEVTRKDSPTAIVSFQQADGWNLTCKGDGDMYWSVDDIKGGSHLKQLRGMTLDEIHKMDGSDKTLLLFVKAGEGTPHSFTLPVAQKNNWLPGIDLMGLNVTDPKAADNAPMGNISVRLMDKLAKEFNAPTAFQITFTKIPGLVNAGALQFAGVTEKMAGLFKFTGLSPVTVTNIDITDNGLSMSGIITADVPLIKDSPIEFSVNGNDVRISKTFNTGEIKAFPKPFVVNDISLSVFASTEFGFGLEGDIDFAIQGLGKGFVSGMGASKDGFGVKGEFTFDSKKFQGSKISFQYLHQQWTIGGKIVIPQGNGMKGIDHGSLSITYGADKITADGNVVMTVPGIDNATLHAVIDGNGGFTLGGQVDLKALPGIKSGAKVTATVSRASVGADYSLSVTGEAEPNLPKIPKLNPKITIGYKDGLFKAECQSDFGSSGGMITGNFMVGVTNGTVTDGVLQGTEGGKSVSFYGTGVLHFLPFKGVDVSMTVKVNSKGEALFSFDLNASVTPFDKLEKDLPILTLKNDIPLFGVPLLTLNLRVEFNAVLQLKWLPLTIGVKAAITDKTYDELIHGKFDTNFALTLGTSGSVALDISVGAGVTARLVVAVGGATVNGHVTLEADADVTGELDAVWNGEKGLKLKGGKGVGHGALKLKLGLTGRAFVDLDLIVSTTNIWEKIWKAGETEPKTLYDMSVEAPFEFDDNNQLKPFDPSKIKFTPALDKDTASSQGDQAVGNKEDKGQLKGDDKLKEDIRQQIRANLRAHSENQSQDMYAYAAHLQRNMATSNDPKITNFVLQAIEEELKALETEQFWTFKNDVLNSKDPKNVKLGKIDQFQHQHNLMDQSLIQDLRNEVNTQAASTANSSSANNQVSRKPMEVVQLQPHTPKKAPVQPDFNLNLVLTVPKDDPKPDYSKLAKTIGAWENANLEFGLKIPFHCDHVVKGGKEWSFVTDIGWEMDNAVFVFQIANEIYRGKRGDLQVNEINGVTDPTAADVKTVFRLIDNRILAHSKEHFARYRTVVQEEEKILREKLKALPGQHSPQRIDQKDLESYLGDLLLSLASDFRHRLWKATCDLEKRDYPTLLKGIPNISGVFKVVCDKDEPALLPEPILVTAPAKAAPVKGKGSAPVKGNAAAPAKGKATGPEKGKAATPGAEIQRNAETDAKGNYTGNYIFDPGHNGLNAGFFNKVKKAVADGLLDDNEIKALRADAIDRNGTVMHAELLLMAAMRNPVNVARMKAYTGGSLTIAMSDIKQADRDYLTNFGVEKNPLDPSAYIARILASLFGLSKEKAADIANEYDTKAMDLIHKYAGKQFSDQADRLIVFCESNPLLPWDEVIQAMLNGAADSTPGDRIMAGTVYAIAKNAGHAMAPKIRSGDLKIDALVPSVFHRIAGDAEAVYQYSTDEDVLKADTYYIQTDLDIFRLRSQALVIHELTHAAEDFAAAGSTSKKEDSLTLESHAYKEQGKYMMDQILGQPAGSGPGYLNAASQYVHDNVLYYWSMVAAAKGGVTKYEATLVSIGTNTPMSKTAAAVKADLALSATDLEKKVRDALVAYRTPTGKQLYSAGTTTIGGPGGHYFVQRSCDPDKQCCMPEKRVVDDDARQQCYIGDPMLSPATGGKDDLISSLFGVPVEQGSTGGDAGSPGIPTASGDEMQLLLQTEYKPTLELLITRHTNAQAALEINDRQLTHGDVGVGAIYGYGVPNANMAGAMGNRTKLLAELNDSKEALDDTLNLVGLSDAAAVANIGDRFIDMFRSKARVVANFMLDQSEVVATAEYQRYAAIPFESSVDLVNDLRKSTQRLGNIQRDFVQVLNFVADEFAAGQGFWGVGRPAVIDENNYSDFLGGAVFGMNPRVQKELSYFRKAIEEEGLKFPVLMKEKLNYVELGYHTSDAELIQSAMGIAARTLDDIKKSRDKIDDDNIWDLNPVIAATVALFQLTSKSYAFVYLQEYLKRRQRNKTILDIFLSAVGIILSIVAIFATGGLAIFAIVGGAAVGGVQTYRHYKQYQFEKAARGSSLDTSQSIGRDFDPSALSLAFDMAMTLVSFLQAAKAVRGLGAAATAAEQSGTALERIGVNAAGKAGTALEPIGINAQSMGFGINVQRFAAAKGFTVEQISEDAYRITHAEVKGEYILTRQSIRYQVPSGNGMRTKFEIPFKAEGGEPGQGLLPEDSATDTPTDPVPKPGSPGQKALPPGKPPVRPPRPRVPRVEVGEADLDAMRLQYNIPENANTIGIGRTDVEGLAGRPFYGGSRTIRAYAPIPDGAPHIYSPRTMYLSIDHAEQDIANQFIDAVEAAGLKAEALEGKTLAMHISHPRGPCFACMQGEAGSGVNPGILFNLSNRYPGLTIRVTWLDAQDVQQGLVIVGGVRY